MRKIFSGLLVAFMVAFLAACGGSNGSQAGDASAKADAKQLTKANFAKRMAEAQKDKTSYAFTLEMHDKSQQTSGQGAVANGNSPDTIAMQMTMSDPTMGTMTVILINKTIYVQAPELSGSKYIAMGMDDPLIKDAGLDPSADFGSIADPQQLADAMVSFKDLGDGGVMDGVKTRKLEIVVDTKKATDSGLIDSSEYEGVQLPPKVAYNLWVGVDDDLVRRMSTDFGGVSMTLDMSKWGEPVNVTAPPASETMSMSDMYGAS